MKSILHKAATRGQANHGWLDSNHTFSFGHYTNPKRMNFGVLRVLNDDIVSPGKGFGTHEHQNMEIISIPLEGDLEHKDSLGNVAVIKSGDIQAMSAGTGVYHSEINESNEKEVKFLQIWLFPNKRNVEPRYDQITLNPSKMKNKFHQILSPNKEDEGVWIYQDAWFSMGLLDEGITLTYHFKNKGNGLYIFVIKGGITVNGTRIEERDGYGIWDSDSVEVIGNSSTKVLLMEVPMNLN